MDDNSAKSGPRWKYYKIDIKIVVMGPGASGKTELCNRFTKRDFIGNPKATIGVAFDDVTFRIGEEEFSVGVWDTAGQEIYMSLNTVYFRGAKGVVFVYDVTDEKNFLETAQWIKKFKHELDHDCEVIIVGNKCDLEKRHVSRLSGYKLAHEHGAKFFEVSAKTNKNVQEAFNELLRGAISRMKQDTIPRDVSQDPYALLLYEKALEAGKEKDKSIRVNIVGNFRQGKTTLMRRLLGQKIKSIESTEGINVEHYKCEKTEDGKFRYTKGDNIDKAEYIKRLVNVAECKNDEIEEQPTEPFSESTVLVEKNPKDVKDTPAGNSQMNMDTETTDASSNDNQIINEVSNKISVLSHEEKGIFAQALMSNDASAQKERQTIFDIWDFGGQYIFYATHTIFHSKRAIYLLVFDLSLGLSKCVTDKLYPTESENRNMKYFIEFWMSSIHSFVGSADGSLPKVILVGTHRDKLKGTKHEKEKYIKQYFEDIRQMFDGTQLCNHIYSDDFAVDNTSEKDRSLNLLRETIIRVGDEQSETYEIPLKWIQLEKAMLERKHLKLISVKFVMALDLENEFPLGDKEQVKLFLRYHHAKGTFIYFDEEPISEYVVLDPQYLIDAFKCIITSERFCTNDPEIRPLWKTLLTEGRLEKQLIDRQWGKPENRFEMFAENKEILLSFLVKHHIISEAAVFDDNTQQSTGLEWYVVPSLLSDHSARTEFKEFLYGKRVTELRYVLLFDISPIVPTVYHRLVSAAIGKWPIAKYDKKMLIFKDRCVVRLNIDHAGIAEMKYDRIEMTVVSLCPTTDLNGGQADNFRRFSEAVLANEFQKLRSFEESHRNPYTIWFRCNHEQHGEGGSKNLIALDDVECGKVLPCPDLMNHDINAARAREEWFQDSKKIQNIPDEQLTEKLLGRISQCIGENWELLGLELGLSQVQIDHICEENIRAVMRIYTMLYQWYRDNIDTSTLKVLVEALQRCPLVRIDWDGLRNIIDEES